MDAQYDVIVVGTGPAGGTIAAGMAGAGQRVLMLEKGAYHPRFLLGKQIPSLLLLDKMGASATKEGLPVARGITVGGSALVSCGAATPAFPGMFEAVGMDLRDEIEKAHDYMHIDDDFPQRLIGKGQMHLMEVANSLGFSFRKMKKFVRADKCREGCSCMKGCPTGAKWSGRVPVEEARSQGAILRTRTEVVKVLVQQGEAAGVETRQGEAFLSKIVVLSAGGLGSPPILRNSGIVGAGDKFGMDPLRFTYGFHRQYPMMRDMDMGIVDDSLLESDGFILSPVMHTWAGYLSAVPRASGLPPLASLGRFGRAVSVMTKIQDDLGGTIYEDGTFSKPLTDRDRAKLDRGEQLATLILKKAGCDANTIFSCKPGAAHPCASVRIGDHIDTNFETRIRNLFVCDTSSFPKPMGLPCVWTCTALGLRMTKILKDRLHATSGPGVVPQRFGKRIRPPKSLSLG